MFHQQAEADTCVGKLEAADDFIKEVNPNEPKVNHEQKKVNSKHQVTSDKFSSLPVSVGGAEVIYSLGAASYWGNQTKPRKQGPVFS